MKPLQRDAAVMADAILTFAAKTAIYTQGTLCCVYEQLDQALRTDNTLTRLERDFIVAAQKLLEQMINEKIGPD